MILRTKNIVTKIFNSFSKIYKKSFLNLNLIKKHKIIPAVIILLILLISSCKEEPPVVPPNPPPDYRKITLAEEGKSCTEIWLKITADSIDLPAQIKLFVNNSFQFVNLTGQRDTVIYFSELQFNTDYSYKAELAEDTTIKSEEVKIKTLAPTSHNFSYQTWEFGDLPGNFFFDAAIIDENNIWVVGDLEIDSAGNDIKYNAAHWDGNEWGLLTIYYIYNGSEFFRPIRAIFSFNENDIWFSNFTHWNGGNFESIDLNISYPASVYGIWGTEDNNIIIVGEEGRMALFNRSNWQSILSPTGLALTDIYSNGNGDIYVAGVNSSEVKGVVLKGNEAGEFNIMVEGAIISENELFNPNLYGILGSVWVDENNTLYTGGTFLYRYKNNSWNYVESLPSNYIGGNPTTYRGNITSIRGNSVNDIVIAGTRNTIKHFNGIDWEQLGLPYDPSSNIIWRDVEMRGNTVIAVGNKGSKAFIILLKR